jgi:hypothetical protein
MQRDWNFRNKIKLSSSDTWFFFDSVECTQEVKSNWCHKPSRTLLELAPLWGERSACKPTSTSFKLLHRDHQLEIHDARFPRWNQE